MANELGKLGARVLDYHEAFNALDQARHEVQSEIYGSFLAGKTAAEIIAAMPGPVDRWLRAEVKRIGALIDSTTRKPRAGVRPVRG